jgi:hypothetical protein
MPLKGTLGEAFELSGRGVVVFLEDSDGAVRAGEELVVGDTTWEIVNVGVPSGRKTREQLQKGLPVTLAAQLRDAKKSDLASLTGQPFSTRMPKAVTQP